LTLLTISPEVARRYLLGRQGLWPGRRWRGKAGAAKAIHTLESVQVDPLTIVARSHDLVLWSRVEGYSPAHLDSLLYKERRFFDYGGHLDIYPMEELPYWRVHMRQRREHGNWREWSKLNAAVVKSVLRRVRDEGPLSARDFEGPPSAQDSYRGSKAAGVALYYLWLTGHLMTHSRRGSERVYDLFERVAPPEFQHEATAKEEAWHFDRKWIRSAGLTVASGATSLVLYGLRHAVGPSQARERMKLLVAEGYAVPARVEGVREQYYVPVEDVPLIETLAKGRAPRAWKPLSTTTDEEANFLSPLDNLRDRRRTKAIFGFEYLWEIYKKPEQRRWGRYTMPILYQDRLVGRFDPRLNRKTGTLSLEGFWLEDESTARDEAFASALARGLERFAAFHNATVDVGALGPAPLCERVRERLARNT